MKAHWVVLLAAVFLGAGSACGSGGTKSTGSAGLQSGNSADGGGTSTTAGASANPDGVLYPSPPNGYGRKARSGATPGSVMANFKYFGYPNGDPSQGLQLIAMADYYDPCQKRYKLIHLSVSAVWCNPCNAETDAIVAAKAQLDGQQVVMLQALDDGPTMNVGATQGDLDRWVTRHHVNFTEMLDPGLGNLGGFFEAAAVPWNCDIDPRTMEIIDQATGWAGDVTVELAPALTAVQGPPRYPLAVTCN
jgi:hypothetical protein